VVARETACLDAHLCEGKVGGKDATTFPFPITREIMTRGRERFDIYCAVCHGRTGDGDGMIVQRGLKHPPSYHIERLVSAPVGHYFDVMTNGFQTMYSSKDRVSVQDRWAIIAYIRALQFSRRASLKDVPPDVREKLAREGKGSQ
jgi:cytochrome c